MARKALNRPTDAELGILQVLWRRGPSTVREVRAELDGSGYTTVLKTLQIMTEKGLVVRDESGRAHVYAPRDERVHVQRNLVGDLLERAFEGSASQLVLQALSARPASAEELAEIRQVLDGMTLLDGMVSDESNETVFDREESEGETR